MNFTVDWASKHHNIWMTFLGKLAGTPCCALEIGSLEGRSSLWFLTHILTHPDSRIHCIDPWTFMKGTDVRFFANIKESGLAFKVQPTRAHSCDVSFPLNYYNFAYVDGAHTPFDMMQDCMRTWAALKKGGVMIVDDRLWQPEKGFPIKEAADYLERIICSRKEGSVLHRDYQLILRKEK